MRSYAAGALVRRDEVGEGAVGLTRAHLVDQAVGVAAAPREAPWGEEWPPLREAVLGEASQLLRAKQRGVVGNKGHGCERLRVELPHAVALWRMDSSHLGRTRFLVMYTAAAPYHSIKSNT